ncbi:unnamed protein product [Fraxinus pennsylvanica]|uniref:Uncharacterized protein n=1 Tax=Fraxinus pennsylvanica TaxID=56036 RepID=A0AAD1ZLF8_9LAMI|nr:unnamed protein product [Fraxinus pennsylvanica]
MSWDIFIARTNEKHSEVAASYIEQPQQQQQSQEQQHPQQQHEQQHQQQQQQRWDVHILNGSANGIVWNDALTKQNSGTANAPATKMHEDRLKLSAQTDSLNDAALKEFLDVKAFQSAIEKAAIAQHFDLRIVKSDPIRGTAVVLDTVAAGVVS